MAIIAYVFLEINMPDLGISMNFLHLSQICHRIKFHLPQSLVFPVFLRNLYQVFFLDK